MMFEQPRYSERNARGVDRFFAEVRKQYMRADLARNFMRRAVYAGTHGTPLLCEKPDDVIGAQQFFASAIAAGLYDKPLREHRFDNDPQGEHWVDMKANIVGSLLEAQPFLLRKRAAALAAKFNLPDHIVSRTVMPYETMFFAFECTGMMDLKVEDADDGNTYCGMLAVAEADHLFATMMGTTASGDNALRVIWDPVFGHRFPEDTASFNELLQVLNFMQSKIAVCHKQPASRAARRSMPRAKCVQRDVGIVDLREYERAPETPAATDGEHTDIDYKWRWMVRGHYRAQWYATEKAHHLIWIAPFVKGPQDKPLRPTVYDVRR